MPDNKTLNILTINCNKIIKQERDRAAKCSTNTACSHVAVCEQHYANTGQGAGKLRNCYTYTSIYSNLKSNSADRPSVNNNETNHFLSGPNQDNDKRVSTEIKTQIQSDFEDVFSRIGCFDGMFLLQVKPDIKPYQAPPRFVVYALSLLKRS